MDRFLQDCLNNNGRSAAVAETIDRPALVNQEATEPVKVNWIGRARRREYFPVFIVCNAALRTLYQVKEPDSVTVILSVVIGMVLIVEHVRRLHDIGKSGWWILSFLIPFMWIITWRKGQSGPNEYGPDPRVPRGGQK